MISARFTSLCNLTDHNFGSPLAIRQCAEVYVMPPALRHLQTDLYLDLLSVLNIVGDVQLPQYCSTM